jgi:hypothetical protein
MKKLIKVFLLFLFFTAAFNANSENCPCYKEDNKECVLSPAGFQISIPIEYKEESKNYTLCGASLCMPSYLIEREQLLNGTIYDGKEFKLILCNGENKLDMKEIHRYTKKCTISNKIECN